MEVEQRTLLRFQFELVAFFFTFSDVTTDVSDLQDDNYSRRYYMNYISHSADREVAEYYFESCESVTKAAVHVLIT